MKNKKLWFKAKMYGWGWTPISWQGWVITLLYIATIILNAQNIDAKVHSGSDALIQFAFPFIINTIFLLVICYAKGEKPSWHWGEK